MSLTIGQTIRIHKTTAVVVSTNQLTQQALVIQKGVAQPKWLDYNYIKVYSKVKIDHQLITII
jgi:hypothetical protein